MAVLTLGILSLVAAYSSGYVAMKRATRVSSAQMLADSQMERLDHQLRHDRPDLPPEPDEDRAGRQLLPRRHVHRLELLERDIQRRFPADRGTPSP